MDFQITPNLHLNYVQVSRARKFLSDLSCFELLLALTSGPVTATLITGCSCIMVAQSQEMAGWHLGGAEEAKEWPLSSP